MNRLLALLTALLLVPFGAAQPTVDGTIADGEYANSVTHEETGVVISWTVAGDAVHLAVHAASEGWFGIGIGPEIDNRKMGFDQYLFTMIDGAAVALDMYQGRARGEPVLDEEEGGTNSISEYAAVHDGAAWTIEFVRPLDTGEETDVAIVPGSEMVIAIAFAEDLDPEEEHPKARRGGAFYLEGFVF